MDHETTKKQKKSRLRSANWTVSQTRLLLKLMKRKQQELGEENFDGEVWHQITLALNKKSRPSRKVEQVKMKIKMLRSEFNDYRMFVQKPGWCWDSKRKLPIAPNERCWDEIIESNKRLSKCRTKAFPWYKLVAEISRAEVPAGENEPSGSTNDTMDKEKLLLLGTGTEQSAGENAIEDMSSSDATPSIYKEATNNLKLVAKKLVKVRSQFKLSRSDFMDMSVVVRDDLNRELFMEQEGKELLDWIKDSLDTYRKQFKAHQGMQQPTNRQFFIPCYPYPPGGTPQPPM